MSETDLRHFEDLAVGERLALGAYRVTREEIVAFAAEFDPQPFHLDEAAAARSMAGGLCASGWHTCAMMMRMWNDGWLKTIASMGAPGIEEIRWRRPVRPGDVLSGESEIVAKRASRSRPGMGFLDVRHVIRNGAGETVAELRHPFMVAARVAGGEGVA